MRAASFSLSVPVAKVGDVCGQFRQNGTWQSNADRFWSPLPWAHCESITDSNLHFEVWAGKDFVMLHFTGGKGWQPDIVMFWLGFRCFALFRSVLTFRCVFAIFCLSELRANWNSTIIKWHTHAVCMLIMRARSMGMTYFSVLLRALPQSHTSNHQMDPAPKCEVFFIAFLGSYCRVISFNVIYPKLSGNGISLHFHAEVLLVLVEFFRFLCSWSIHCAEKNQKKQCNQISLKQNFKRTNDHKVSFITKTYKTYQCLDLQLATIIIIIMSVSVHYVKVQRSVFPFTSNRESLSRSSGDFFLSASFSCWISF